MMTRTRMISLLVVCCLTAAAPANPPARPLQLTSPQYAALCELEQEPAHAAIQLVHATYLSEHEKQMEQTRFVNDATTLATFAGYIGAIVTILIMASPI